MSGTLPSLRAESVAISDGATWDKSCNDGKHSY